MNYRVTMRCTVTKWVYCEDCTEDEAREDPWKHAVGEDEIEQADWKILKVEPYELT